MTNPNALIVGASRGLGLEFVRQYRAAGWAVTGTARADDGLQRIQDLGARALRVDVASAAGAAALAWPLDGEHFDVVVINAGVYGPRHSGLEAPTQEEFDAVMHTNVLGAMRVLPQLLDVLAPNAKVAVISSRMGSIGLRTASGGWLYRASKAALNSVLKDAALVLGDKARCVAFHPGWVRTDMGGQGADIDATESVAGMRQVLAGLTAESSGSFINYDGTPLQW
jgi:NAD(P)-dependent dehydrogenase (short-subunit alcohol dehydrogenase family)